MSGCHPINTDPCLCSCHKIGGYRIENCCNCKSQIPFFSPATETPVSPMVKKIQDLEERIKESETAKVNLVRYEVLRELLQRIEKLESENKMRQDTIACIDTAYNDANLDLERRIIKLEEHKTYQIDENRKTSRRVDELESLLDIEKMKLIVLDGANLHATILKFESRVKDIEKTALELVDKIAEIASFYYKEKKTPHRCPVCEGSKFNKPELKNVDAKITIDGIECEAGNTIYWKSICSVCEGKGIIWN